MKASANTNESTNVCFSGIKRSMMAKQSSLDDVGLELEGGDEQEEDGLEGGSNGSSNGSEGGAATSRFDLPSKSFS